MKKDRNDFLCADWRSCCVWMKIQSILLLKKTPNILDLEKTPTTTRHIPTNPPNTVKGQRSVLLTDILLCDFKQERNLNIKQEISSRESFLRAKPQSWSHYRVLILTFPSEYKTFWYILLNMYSKILVTAAFWENNKENTWRQHVSFSFRMSFCLSTPHIKCQSCKSIFLCIGPSLRNMMRQMNREAQKLLFLSLPHFGAVLPSWEHSLETWADQAQLSLCLLSFSHPLLSQ